MNFLLLALEDYLRQEGLSQFLPPQKVKSWTTSILLVVMIIFLMIVPALVVGYFGRPYWIGVVIPICALGIVFFVMIIFFVIRQLFYKRSIAGEDSSKIGSSILFGVPFLIVIGIWIYFWSWIPAAVSLLAMILTLALILFLFNKYHWFYLSIELVGQVIKSLSFSLRSIVSIVPVLLVTIILYCSLLSSCHSSLRICGLL